MSAFEGKADMTVAKFAFVVCANIARKSEAPNDDGVAGTLNVTECLT